MVDRNQLIEAVADDARIRKADARKAVDAVFDAINNALKNGDEVRLVGFDDFVVSKPSTGRNPRMVETIILANSKLPKFKRRKVLKPGKKETGGKFERGSRLRGVFLESSDTSRSSEVVPAMPALTRHLVVNPTFNAAREGPKAVNFPAIETEGRSGAYDQKTNWSRLQRAFDRGDGIPGYIIGPMKGGYIVELQGLRGFLPKSQVSPTRLDNVMKDDLNQQLFRITRMDRARGIIFLSCSPYVAASLSRVSHNNESAWITANLISLQKEAIERCNSLDDTLKFVRERCASISEK